MISRIFSLPMLLLLAIYKWVISPVLQMFGVTCRHHPSCSTYSVEAIEKHGPWQGGWLTLARLSRCQPWGTSGVDNVPEEITNPPIWAPWRVGLWRRTNSE